jgi:signal peptidase II
MAAPDLAGRAGLRWLAVSLLVLVLDQASKLYVLAVVPEFSRIPVIPGFFDWTLTYNEGVAFSLFGDGEDLQRYLLSAFAIAVSIGFMVWLTRLPRDDRWSALALSLVIGGALGNVIDRLRLGHVVDFILVYWREWHWPAFNIADSCIVVGAILLVLAGFRSESSSRG